MSIKRVASRYAKSLLDLAIEQDRLEKIKEDMESLQRLLKQSKDFAAFLKSPVIQHQRKREILEKMFSGKLDDLTLKFMAILAGKQREAHLGEVVNQFMEQYLVLKHISIVRITSSSALTTEQQEMLRQKLEASAIGFEHIELVLKVDPSLLGGFIVELDDHVYDVSIRHQLDSMRKQFKTNLYESKIYAR